MLRVGSLCVKLIKLSAGKWRDENAKSRKRQRASKDKIFKFGNMESLNSGGLKYLLNNCSQFCVSVYNKFTTSIYVIYKIISMIVMIIEYKLFNSKLF